MYMLQALIAGFGTGETHYNTLLIYAVSRPTLVSYFAYIGAGFKTDSPHFDFQKTLIAGFETDETHYNNLLIYAVSRPTLFAFVYIVAIFKTDSPHSDFQV